MARETWILLRVAQEYLSVIYVDPMCVANVTCLSYVGAPTWHRWPCKSCNHLLSVTKCFWCIQGDRKHYNISWKMTRCNLSPSCSNYIQKSEKWLFSNCQSFVPSDGVRGLEASWRVVWRQKSVWRKRFTSEIYFVEHRPYSHPEQYYRICQ